MKTRFLKSAITLVLVCALAFSLSGCDSLDYREAIELYNAQEYEAAAEIFYALGDFEDSKDLYTRCQYWIAMTLMEQGNFQEALPRFIKLGNYEDSVLRAKECKYQRAIAEFDNGNLRDAENLFQDAPDYKQTPEYLRRITWQTFFDALAQIGTLQTERDGKMYSLTADAEANRLVFFVSQSKEMGYSFYDDLTLTLSRDTTEAEFIGTSTFTMGFKSSQIGSQQKASGSVDITTCNAETVLSVTTFEMTGTDNFGSTISSNDPADSHMDADLAENLSGLMTVIPELLTESGMELTLQDIGFYAI